MGKGDEEIRDILKNRNALRKCGSVVTLQCFISITVTELRFLFQEIQVVICSSNSTRYCFGIVSNYNSIVDVFAIYPLRRHVVQ